MSEPGGRDRGTSGEYKLLPHRIRALVERAGPDSPFSQLAGPALDGIPSRPTATPAGPPKKLTIGMATYDDFDGVYFTVQAIRLYHPEVTPDTEIIVVDNHPEGHCAGALKDLERWVPGYRYVPYDRVQGTAVRDLLFREASSDCVLCVDSHVLLAPGAIRQLIEYFASHPDTPDLLQGPMLDDGLQVHATHFELTWRMGMYGVWGNDERGANPDGEPWEVPSQGLGVFACRRAAWPGLNPRLSGFGGEEGYVHEKFRQRGGRTLCLPFLRWLHRFGRPSGAPYQPSWEDRIRNYMLIADELDRDDDAVLEHFTAFLGKTEAERLAAPVRAELASPFHFFDGIYCINLDVRHDRWARVKAQSETLGILRRVRRFPAIETPGDHHVGCALSHRAIIAEAKSQALDHVLVLEDDVIFHRWTDRFLAGALAELDGRDWGLLYLGGFCWASTPARVPGCRYLGTADAITCTHAIVYNARVYDRLLSILPDATAGMESWLAEHVALDQYLSNNLLSQAFVVRPFVATQAELIAGQDPGWWEGLELST